MARDLSHAVVTQFHKCQNDVLKLCCDINKMYEIRNERHEKKSYLILFKSDGSCFDCAVLKLNRKIGLEII
jgi:hypothetical protein